MQTIRLLGGSHHGKKIEIAGADPFIYMVKKQKKKKWSPSDFLVDSSDTYYVIDHEKYDRQYIRNITAISLDRWLVETKVIYLKEGSKVKQETMWKLGTSYEKRIQEYTGALISDA